MNSLSIRGAQSLVAALILSVLAAPALSAANAFSKIVVFGDSLNDYGNMAQFSGGAFPNAPLYVYGRQSNGPLWVEYLAGQLGMANRMVNYAVVGAMTKPAPGFPTGNVWSSEIPGLEGTDVTTQVQDYLADSNGVADPTALHILEGGANDFGRVADLTTTVGNLLENFLALQQAGAKHIAVVTLPDIGKTPRLILGELLGHVQPGTAAYLSQVCSQLNAALRELVTQFTAPGVNVTMVDLYAFMNTVAGNPAAFGIVEPVSPYLLSGVGADPATWLFWDDLHPTTRGHEIFAEDAAAALIRTYSPRHGNANASAGVRGLHGLVGSGPNG